MQAECPRPFQVYGLTQSYFTRKMTGYLDYKGIPWFLRRSGGMAPEALAAGFPGGIPALRSPEGEFLWDSTAMIHHLERRFPEPSVFPPDPVQRFLCYVIEDFCDEWLYRPAVGSRWHYAENAAVGGYELGRDVTVSAPLTADEAHALVGTHVRSSCPPLGVTEHNIGAWIEEVLRPWLRLLGRHLAAGRFLFGERPSLADFAVFGGSAAHFVNDPACRRWTEADGPSIVLHTHRLLEPQAATFGRWDDPDCVEETLIDLLAELGRLYLPWVSRATVERSAYLEFKSVPRALVHATDFLVDARAILLARYVELRCAALDDVLARARILDYFARFTKQAGRVPDDRDPPRPRLNRPFPPPSG